MGNLATSIRAPVCILICGKPGSGKTGSTIALAEAGYNLRIMDYDGNTKPIEVYASPEAQARYDAVRLGDAMVSGTDLLEVKTPTGYRDGLRLMDRWRYETLPNGVERVLGRPPRNFKTGEDMPDNPPPTGVVTDLGCSKDWGPDTVVVLDGLTAQGECIMSKVMDMMNRVKTDRVDTAYGIAMGEQRDFIKRVRAPHNRFHFIAFAHMKMIGPQDYRGGKGGDSEIAKMKKEQESNLMETRWYPTVLGRQLPQEFARLFPVQLLYENEDTNKGVRQRIWTTPRMEVDLKVPALGLPNSLPISDGLLTVFKALGATPPKDREKGESA